MEKDTDNILIYPALLPGGGLPPDSVERRWKMARDRMLSYLDALGIPPLEAMDLTNEVIDRTRGRAGAGGSDPVPETMRVLRAILKDRDKIDTVDNTCRIPELLSLPAAPKLNPGAMIPQRLDTAPWNGLVGRTLTRIHFRGFGPYVGLILAMIVIYFMI